MKRPSARITPIATDAELWLRRFVILQAFMPAPFLMLVVAAYLLLRGTGASVPTPVIVGVLAAMTALELSVIVLWGRARRRSRAHLLATAFMVCPGCRYALTASAPSGTCPECGRPYSAPDLRRLWEAAYWGGLDRPSLSSDE